METHETPSSAAQSSQDAAPRPAATAATAGTACTAATTASATATTSPTTAPTSTAVCQAAAPANEGFAPCGRIEAHPLPNGDDPFRPRWMDIEDPGERQCAHIVDTLGFCGHYIHIHGGGRSGRAPIICALLKHGDAMPQRELMNMFDLKAGSLSEVLAKIERDGLIERTRDPQDRRQLIVRLTEKGHAQAEREQTERERFRAEALTCLTTDERALLEDMLARIKERWRSISKGSDKEDCACSSN